MKNVLYKIMFNLCVFLKILLICTNIIFFSELREKSHYSVDYDILLVISTLIILLSFILEHNNLLNFVAIIIGLIVLIYCISDIMLLHNIKTQPYFDRPVLLRHFNLFYKIKQAYKRHMFYTIFYKMSFSQSDTITVTFFFQDYIIPTIPMSNLENSMKLHKIYNSIYRSKVEERLIYMNFRDIPLYAISIYYKILLESKDDLPGSNIIKIFMTIVFFEFTVYLFFR
jgi:hypothetical protein